MGLTHWITEQATALINWGGYGGVAFLMALESMIAPVPSEAVMPFAGFLIFEQKFTWEGVIFFSTLGSFIGSLLSYYMGYFGGRPLVERWGKYLLLNVHHLELTEQFFSRYGWMTIFISRFTPVVRHLISIPAGAGKMPLLPFVIYTILGAATWNAILTYVGFLMRENWQHIMKYHTLIDSVVVLCLLIGFSYVFYKLYSAQKRARSNG
jgi:membrane protein DedA with SNARE-associated domain